VSGIIIQGSHSASISGHSTLFEELSWKTMEIRIITYHSLHQAQSQSFHQIRLHIQAEFRVNRALRAFLRTSPGTNHVNMYFVISSKFSKSRTRIPSGGILVLSGSLNYYRYCSPYITRQLTENKGSSTNIVQFCSLYSREHILSL
jgi:hypothetical protein